MDTGALICRALPRPACGQSLTECSLLAVCTTTSGWT